MVVDKRSRRWYVPVHAGRRPALRLVLVQPFEMLRPRQAETVTLNTSSATANSKRHSVTRIRMIRIRVTGILARGFLRLRISHPRRAFYQLSSL